MEHKGEPYSLMATAVVTIRFNECDPLGIVWHGNYMKYFEDGREAFTKSFGLDYLELFNQGFATPIVHIHANYKRSLKYKDVAIVETTFVKTDAAKIIFNYTIRSQDDNSVICTGSSTQVFLTSDTRELVLTVPEVYKKWKREFGL